jgi:hypothetical protein
MIVRGARCKKKKRRVKEADGNVWIQILCKDASRNLVTGNFQNPTDRR